MTRRLIVLIATAILLTLTWPAALAQVPPELSFVRVRVDARVPVKRGAEVRAHTASPLYSDGQLILPLGTPIIGKVVDVFPAPRSVRVEAKFRGDFTPLRDATLVFDRVVDSKKNVVKIESEPTDKGSEILRFSSQSSAHRSLFKRAWSDLLERAHGAMTSVNSPGRADRMKRLLYSQLPLHPQTIEPGTEYDVRILKLAEPVVDNPLVENPPQPRVQGATTLHARLLQSVSSSTAKDGENVSAIVTEPKLDAANHVEVPQGAILSGEVVRAKPAKSHGRQGDLQFSFNQIEFPAGSRQTVTGIPAAVETSRQRLKLDPEGIVQPDVNKSAIAPLVTGLLSATAFHDDEAQVTHAVLASNGFGLIGRVVAWTTGSRIVGATFGAITTGRLIYSRFLAHGKNVEFPRGTAIEIDVGASHKQPLTPQ